MTNQLYILVCVTLLLMTGVLLVASRRERRQTDRRWSYTLFYAGLMVWQGMELCFFMSENPLWLRYFYDAKLAVVAFLSVLMFFTMAEFYRLDGFFPSWLPPVLGIIPAITALLALTTHSHSVMLHAFDVLDTEPLTIINATRGPWFYVHTVYSLSMLGAIAVIITARYQSLPKAYRGGAWHLVLALAALVAGVVAEFLKPVKNSVDYVLVAATAAGLLFYVAIVRNGRSDYLQIERREIFNYLDPAVFVLSLDGRVLDINRPARSFLELLGEKAEGEVYDAVIARLYDTGKIAAKQVEEIEAEGDSYFVTVQYPVIYRQRRRDMLDQNGGLAGAVVTLEDVTRNRLFIERLQSMAGIDGLTGLYNRYGYQTLLRQLDKPENLPLCVIMGDVNGLKRVNDTYGHAEGDRFLIAVADSLRACLEEGSHAARVGGDEFVIVLPGSDEARGQAVIQAVHQALAATEGLPEQPSIALGLAVKTEAGQNINSLVASADTRMYSSKAPSGSGRP